MCMCYIFNVASLSHFISRSWNKVFFAHFQFSLLILFNFTSIAVFYRTFVDNSWIFSICLIAHRYQIFNRFNSLVFTVFYCFYSILFSSSLVSASKLVPHAVQNDITQTASELFLSIYHILNIRTNKEAHIGA
jgi:hypothetical protein